MATLIVHMIDPEVERRLRLRATQNDRSIEAEVRQILKAAVGISNEPAAANMRPVVVRLVRTCFACPEQYDAFIGEEKVGYLRLRHGHFRVECPDVWGEMVYEASPKGDGIFDDDERVEHLQAAREAIAEWWRERE
jgi:plasmid stability protein